MNNKDTKSYGKFTYKRHGNVVWVYRNGKVRAAVFSVEDAKARIKRMEAIEGSV